MNFTKKIVWIPIIEESKELTVNEWARIEHFLRKLMIRMAKSYQEVS
jgi:hypothetical protein